MDQRFQCLLNWLRSNLQSLGVPLHFRMFNPYIRSRCDFPSTHRHTLLVSGEEKVFSCVENTQIPLKLKNWSVVGCRGKRKFQSILNTWPTAFRNKHYFIHCQPITSHGKRLAFSLNLQSWDWVMGRYKYMKHPTQYLSGHRIGRLPTSVFIFWLYNYRAIQL